MPKNPGVEKRRIPASLAPKSALSANPSAAMVAYANYTMAAFGSLRYDFVAGEPQGASRPPDPDYRSS